MGPKIEGDILGFFEKCKIWWFIAESAIRREKKALVEWL